MKFILLYRMVLIAACTIMLSFTVLLKASHRAGTPVLFHSGLWPCARFPKEGPDTRNYSQDTPGRADEPWYMDQSGQGAVFNVLVTGSRSFY